MKRTKLYWWKEKENVLTKYEDTLSSEMERLSIVKILTLSL